MTRPLRPRTAPSTGHQALDAAIDQLYQVFRHHPAPAHPLDVCLSCCVDPAVEQALREWPLHTLEARHFYQYNDSAKGPLQPADEVLYFLPRLLELLAQGAHLHHSTELYLDRLGRCDPQAFTAAERAAIAGLALAHFQAGLRQWPLGSSTLFMGENAFSILLMWGIGQVDVTPLLAHWLDCDEVPATLHYIEASHWDFWACGGAYANPFASDHASFSHQLHAWMTQPRHRQVFAQRILDCVDQGLPSDWLPSGGPCGLRQRAAEVFDALVL